MQSISIHNKRTKTEQFTNQSEIIIELFGYGSLGFAICTVALQQNEKFSVK